MISGVVSIGTNSTRALAAEIAHPPRIVLARSTGTRIGEGLSGRGALNERAIQRTLDALDAHVSALREHTSRITAIATSALRRAENGATFAAQVESLVGAPLQIISGEEEARRSFMGAVSGLQECAAQRFGVVDIGGGSTEYAVGSRRSAQRVASCEMGAVRLTQLVPALDGTHGAVSDEDVQRARHIAREAIAPLRTFARVERLVFVGGTASSVVGMMRGSRELFSYADITPAEVDAALSLLLRDPLEQRKNTAGINPQRADILPAGLLILDEVFALTDHEQAQVSSNDLLLGTLLADTECVRND
ncbi:MAG: hypothetical protein ABR508_12755 [Candidatus Baltobacteraceae bacterium]